MVIVTRHDKQLDEIELLKNDIKVLDSLPEISTVHSEDYILIFEGYENVKDFVRYMKTLAYLSTAKVYYVYTTQFDIALQLKDYINCVEISESSIINGSLVEYILYKDNVSKLNIAEGDEQLFVQNLIQTDNIDFVIGNLRSIKLMAISYVEVKNELVKMAERLQVKDIEIQNAIENEEKAKDMYNEVIEGYNFLNNNFKVMRDAYKKCVYSEESFNELELKHYENPPNIIYIKVFEPIIHLNSFLEVLQQTIKMNLGRSSKVVQLVGKNYRYEALTKPPSWYVCSNSFNVKEVYTHEFILKGGDYTELLNKLLSNEMNLDYLIVLDCLNVDKYLIRGNYYSFNMCRNENHLSNYGLDVDTTIVNNSVNRRALSYNTIEASLYSGMDVRSRYLLMANQRAISEIILTLKAQSRQI